MCIRDSSRAEDGGWREDEACGDGGEHARLLVVGGGAVSYTHLRAHETPEHLVCRLLLWVAGRQREVCVGGSGGGVDGGWGEGGGCGGGGEHARLLVVGGG